MFVTMSVSPFLYEKLPDAVKNLALLTRCVVLCVMNTFCIGPMSLVDLILTYDPSGYFAFGIIFTLRAVQGLVVGVLFVIMQVSSDLAD